MVDFEPTESKTVRLAGLLIFDSEGRILLLHRKTKDQDQWELPGGQVESDELPIKAAAREVKEELNVKAQAGEYLGSKGFVEDGVLYDYNWFEGKILEGEPVPNEKKFVEARYWSWDELNQAKDPLSINVGNLLEARSSGKLPIMS